MSGKEEQKEEIGEEQQEKKRNQIKTILWGKTRKLN